MDTQKLLPGHFAISDFNKTKQKVLSWASQFSTFCFLDNQQYQLPYHSKECILAAGSKRSITASSGNALAQLQQFIDQKKSWVFGHLGYDLKNEIEQLQSSNSDKVVFPDLFFFEPETIIHLSKEELIIEAENPAKIFKQLQAVNENKEYSKSEPLNIQQQFSKEEYLTAIRTLQQHILRGDCYEINFCQEFYAENAIINPLFIYQRLCDISPNPFSALYRMQDKWLICASPERYLKKAGDFILSQPMKGTAKRATDIGADSDIISALQNSSKDRSENVMVVDLVRNDLAKICKEGTVKVDELFGVYTFPHVHQMVSTVSGIVVTGSSFTDIIKATFPMGSMTGAPKNSVMELIEQYEKTKRGIFSGAVGYLTPTGDFDFNVVIRSILYNEAADYLSFQAGSGITFYSDAENEWEECLVKAAAIKKVLEEINNGVD